MWAVGVQLLIILEHTVRRTLENRRFFYIPPGSEGRRPPLRGCVARVLPESSQQQSPGATPTAPTPAPTDWRSGPRVWRMEQHREDGANVPEPEEDILQQHQDQPELEEQEELQPDPWDPDSLLSIEGEFEVPEAPLPRLPTPTLMRMEACLLGLPTRRPWRRW